MHPCWQQKQLICIFEKLGSALSFPICGKSACNYIFAVAVAHSMRARSDEFSVGMIQLQNQLQTCLPTNSLPAKEIFISFKCLWSEEIFNCAAKLETPF
jgi:hypothetical protein